MTDNRCASSSYLLVRIPVINVDETRSPTNCAMPEPVQHQQTVVGDSGPLIALAIIGQLEVLPRLYRRVIVPQTVWDEVTVTRRGFSIH